MKRLLDLLNKTFGLSPSHRGGQDTWAIHLKQKQKQNQKQLRPSSIPIKMKNKNKKMWLIAGPVSVQRFFIFQFNAINFDNYYKPNYPGKEKRKEDESQMAALF